MAEEEKGDEKIIQQEMKLGKQYCLYATPNSRLGNIKLLEKLKVLAKNPGKK